MKNISFRIMLYAVLILFVTGCEFSTSVWLDDDYDIRIVNSSGDRIKIIWDDTSYYLDKDESIVISSISFGTHDFEYIHESSRGRIKSSKVYKIKVSSDFVIILQDDYDNGFILSDWDD
ncbi:MAG: hypothetical protein ACUVWN_05300 [bacterium]